MKQVVFVCALFVCALFGFSLNVSASNKVDAKSVGELKAIYGELDNASKNLDLKVFEKYFGENYRLVTGDEKLDKEQMLANLRGQFALMDEITEALSVIESVEVVEGYYVLEVISISVGRMMAEDGRIVEFSITSKSTDFWQKDAKGNWRELAQFDRGNKIEIYRKDAGLA